MTRSVDTAQALLDECWIDLVGLCRLAGVTETWLHQRIDEGLLGPPPSQDRGRFDVAELRRIRRMVALERDFDAVPELAALVVDLEDELAALRSQLHRLGVR